MAFLCDIKAVDISNEQRLALWGALAGMVRQIPALYLYGEFTEDRYDCPPEAKVALAELRSIAGKKKLKPAARIPMTPVLWNLVLVAGPEATSLFVADESGLDRIGAMDAGTIISLQTENVEFVRKIEQIAVSLGVEARMMDCLQLNEE